VFFLLSNCKSNTPLTSVMISLVLKTPRIFVVILLLEGDKKLNIGKAKDAYHRLETCINLAFDIIQTRPICFYP